jgi:hypothetical protein
MLKVITMLLVAASLAACSPEVWQRPGASQLDVTTDTISCQSAAEQFGARSGGYIYGQLMKSDYFDRCMSARGYRVTLWYVAGID